MLASPGHCMNRRWTHKINFQDATQKPIESISSLGKMQYVQLEIKADVKKKQGRLGTGYASGYTLHIVMV